MSILKRNQIRVEIIKFKITRLLEHEKIKFTYFIVLRRNGSFIL